MKKLLGVGLIVGAVGGLGWFMLQQSRKTTNQAQNGVLVPNTANPDLPAVTVPIITNYNPVKWVDGGTLNTSYLDAGWKVPPVTIKDW